MSNIDDILSELGVGGDGAPKRAPRKAPQRSARHTLDQRPGSFSPLPSMPSSQTRFGNEDSGSVDEDPAVLQRRIAAPTVDVGNAVSEVYRPEASDTAEIVSEISDPAKSVV